MTKGNQRPAYVCGAGAECRMVRAYAEKRAAAEDRRGFVPVRSSLGTHATTPEHQGQAPDTPKEVEFCKEKRRCYVRRWGFSKLGGGNVSETPMGNVGCTGEPGGNTGGGALSALGFIAPPTFRGPISVAVFEGAGTV